jgi:hypothetical protein
MSIISKKPRRRRAIEILSIRFKDAKTPKMTVAMMKFENPHNTLVLGLDLCPNGLLKTFPARPKTKWGTPLPIKNPAMKYQTS